eukprot:TRINITY_DN11674_c0_g1_i2.p1 TRINITY_DN11674_c0_g1~~TRINITY_DN11674_c0_g1_i2.p1  ORF type:complete len:492 (+),score=101.10 TRINITY_DN11674_c0_g1_i2:670-2145(+)
MCRIVQVPGGMLRAAFVKGMLEGLKETDEDALEGFVYLVDKETKKLPYMYHGDKAHEVQLVRSYLQENCSTEIEASGFDGKHSQALSEKYLGKPRIFSLSRYPSCLKPAEKLTWLVTSVYDVPISAQKVTKSKMSFSTEANHVVLVTPRFITPTGDERAKLCPVAEELNLHKRSIINSLLRVYPARGGATVDPGCPSFQRFERLREVGKCIATGVELDVIVHIPTIPMPGSPVPFAPNEIVDRDAVVGTCYPERVAHLLAPRFAPKCLKELGDLPVTADLAAPSSWLDKNGGLLDCITAHAVYGMIGDLAQLCESISYLPVQDFFPSLYGGTPPTVEEQEATLIAFGLRDIATMEDLPNLPNSFRYRSFFDKKTDTFASHCRTYTHILVFMFGEFVLSDSVLLNLGSVLKPHGKIRVIFSNRMCRSPLKGPKLGEILTPTAHIDPVLPALARNACLQSKWRRVLFRHGVDPHPPTPVDVIPVRAMQPVSIT